VWDSQRFEFPLGDDVDPILRIEAGSKPKSTRIASPPRHAHFGDYIGTIGIIEFIGTIGNILYRDI
jgi:hypothetical protein